MGVRHGVKYAHDVQIHGPVVPMAATAAVSTNVGRALGASSSDCGRSAAGRTTWSKLSRTSARTSLLESAAWGVDAAPSHAVPSARARDSRNEMCRTRISFRCCSTHRRPPPSATRGPWWCPCAAAAASGRGLSGRDRQPCRRSDRRSLSSRRTADRLHLSLRAPAAS